MTCLEWCTEHNIEYIEACVTSPDFDKFDGDLEGVERLHGAFSAHMWPGMTLKSGDKINKPSLPENEEESDYELVYEVLSSGSAEPFDDINIGWVSADILISNENKEINAVGEAEKASSSMAHSEENMENEISCESSKPTEVDKGAHYEFEDLEQLMSEIGNVRDSLRLMPDFQRREMAANLALKMAAIFAEGSGDDEEGLD